MSKYFNPDYGDYDSPFFRNHRNLIRFAIEHKGLDELRKLTDIIEYDVVETISNIPSVYHVHYNIKSIIGIDAQQMPIYGNRHTLKLMLPRTYPINLAQLYMLSDTWHPNIKSDGQFKGKVCANAVNYGKGFMVSDLVLRVGEMLQYKNYLAELVAPYPEDMKVAQWVREVAEPLNIVNRLLGIYVDDSSLIRSSGLRDEKPKPTIIKRETPETERKRIIIKGSDNKNPTSDFPEVITSILLKGTDKTIQGSGSVTKAGSSEVTARGLVYSTSATPTIADGKSMAGSGLGEFTSTIIGLSGNTTYYIRAFATNSAGTGYGNIVTFTTDTSETQ